MLKQSLDQQPDVSWPDDSADPDGPRRPEGPRPRAAADRSDDGSPLRPRAPARNRRFMMIVRRAPLRRRKRIRLRRSDQSPHPLRWLSKRRDRIRSDRRPKAGSFGAAWRPARSGPAQQHGAEPSNAIPQLNRADSFLAGTYCQLRESLLDGERLQIVPTGTLDHFHRNRGPLRAGISGPLRPEYAGVSPGSRNVPKAGSFRAAWGPHKSR